MRDALAWAENEFGDAQLGNAARTRRLVVVAADAARRPSGVVSQACSSLAAREGAFRLLENSSVRPDDVAEPVYAATLRRCAGEDIVLVPVDGSSLTLADQARTKDLGGIGAWNRGARGIQTMNALAITRGGAPLGLCAQRRWIRAAPAASKAEKDVPQKKESSFWLDILRDVQFSFAEQVPGTRPWFQMDRGADAWPVFKLATELEALITVRAVSNRMLEGGTVLWSTLCRAPIVAKRRIEVPARPPARRKKRINGKRVSYLTKPRRARSTAVVIRAAEVTLNVWAEQGAAITINAVFVREPGAWHPDDRLEWMLLTTHPIRTRRDVLAVVDGYALRWRIEDFHRAWKRGVCRVEETQLRSRDAIFKWAIILAAVATRALRLTHLARKNPHAFATTEFSRFELEAVIALRQPKKPADMTLEKLTLEQVIRWIADIGGYSGPWSGPAGPTVIGRGLYDVLVTARAFEWRDKTR